jgi:vacuole morphology and inheritance protein 14
MQESTGQVSNLLSLIVCRSVEKRKQAASELQEYIEKLMDKNQNDTINTRITVFAAMVNPDSTYGAPQQQERDNPQKRRSGLYGLSVIAVTLFNKKSTEHLDKILPPVIKSLDDKDTKVLLAACDAIFNIVKICKEAILRYKHFLDIFDKIVGLISTTISNDVKEHSKKVDDLLKDTVYRSLDKGLMFDLDQLIDAICEKLKASKNQDG